MRRAGLVVGRDPRAAARLACAPAITTGELDAIAEDNIRSSGATPSFQGYHGFPASICASVNDEVVHGIPGDRVLADGDVISIDCGAIVDGWHGDAAITVAVGEVPGRGDRADAGHRGGDVARHRRGPPRRPGHRHLARRRGPRAPPGRLRHPRGLHRPRHRHRRCTSPRTCPTTAGRAAAPSWSRGWRWRSSRWSRWAARRPSVLDDDWTVVTDDGSWAAHFEHTFTLTPDGAWVLTALDGGEQALSASASLSAAAERHRLGGRRPARRGRMTAAGGSIPSLRFVSTGRDRARTSRSPTRRRKRPLASPSP